MSTVLKNTDGSGFRMYSKGASEIVLRKYGREGDWSCLSLMNGYTEIDKQKAGVDHLRCGKHLFPLPSLDVLIS
jgi:hypothetical protein